MSGVMVEATEDVAEAIMGDSVVAVTGDMAMAGGVILTGGTILTIPTMIPTPITIPITMGAMGDRRCL